MSLVDCTITPLLLEHTLLPVSSTPGRIQHIFFSLSKITTQIFLLLPGTNYCWVDWCSMKWEACLILLHITSGCNRSQDLLILSSKPYPKGHMLSTQSNLMQASKITHFLVLTKQYRGIPTACAETFIYGFFPSYFKQLWLSGLRGY